MKPWVLEVNLLLSVNIDQPLDLKIKSAMLADLFSLVGIQTSNPYTAKASSKTIVFPQVAVLGKKEDKLPAKDKKEVEASLMRALENGLALRDLKDITTSFGI